MLTAIIIVVAFILVGWGLQKFTDVTGRGKAKGGDPNDYDDPNSYWRGL